MISRDQTTGGLCTWALRLPNGSYVSSLETKAETFSIDRAHAWLSQAAAEAFAAAMPWLRGAVAVRTRP